MKFQPKPQQEFLGTWQVGPNLHGSAKSPRITKFLMKMKNKWGEGMTWLNIHLVKAVVFPVVMYECESWTIKKAEHRRIDAFELWCWRRLLRVPWTARRSNQSILKEISHWKDWCWSCSSNTLATWCEELTHLKRPWCWQRLKAGGEGDDRGWDGWMALLTRWTWVWASSGNWWWTGEPGVLPSMMSQSQIRLSNWTEQ